MKHYLLLDTLLFLSLNNWRETIRITLCNVKLHLTVYMATTELNRRPAQTVTNNHSKLQ